MVDDGQIINKNIIWSGKSYNKIIKHQMCVIKTTVDSKKKKENNYNHCHYSNLN